MYAYTYIYYTYLYTCACMHISYGVATSSRLLKIIGLFCRISSLLMGSFAEEIYNFKEPTNRSHPISICYIYIYVSYRYDTYIHARVQR